MTCIIEPGRITCYRGRNTPRKWEGYVEDRQNNIWFVTMTKEEFERGSSVITVFTQDEKVSKKFKKEFLTYL